MREVFWRFLGLGCVSFGGPVAHIAYFRTAFVQQLGWLSEDEFMTRLSLCNLLPGPTSSQLGFAIGHHRAGLAGAIAAFIGFTLPSFLIMLVLAGLLFVPAVYADSTSYFNYLVIGLIGGLKLAALIIVVDALLTMGLTFCRSYALIVLALAALLWFMQPIVSINPLVPMLLGAVIHWVYLRVRAGEAQHTSAPDYPVVPIPSITWVAAMAFTLGLLWSVFKFAATPMGGLTDLFLSFYQVGASTFGGGHVVLPLLFERFAHLLSEDVLLTAYASAQAVPGPMFTIASFLGVHIALTDPASGFLVAIAAAFIATVGIFLPGFLLLAALLPIWQRFSNIASIVGLLAGVNAVVVGLLAAALLQFVAPSAIGAWPDLAVAVILFALMRWVKLPVWVVLLTCMTYGLIS